ncbi:TIGR03084 family metal-binding protein [Sphingorhabdus arenilitoris]|uniref:TIGR03084 family metal-binding protein n=1 Tax=Sphingorhabdus arenilitoris TaxID=1490041 RepID=A0ABV8RCD2_9SPHN
MQQADDFLDECEALHGLVARLSDADFEQETLFKRWTISNILRHLHVWNIAADLSLTDEAGFTAMLRGLMGGARGIRFTEAEAAYLGGLSGQALLSAWIARARETAAHFASADPKARLKWVGPDMSARSSISARLMETWAHGQAVYDVLGQDRVNCDAIGNIVRLGVNTFGWTYKNRRMEVPAAMPYVRLTAPSGVIWDYGEESSDERIEGAAAEFCQVVTQCRNIADTQLRVTGETAREWMAMAQCFAGPPNDPPAPGRRHKSV